jgi:Uma2 family endonuclease
MGEALEKTDYTVEDYIAIERESLEKMEYYHGEIFAMAGGSFTHGLLGGNIIAGLKEAIRKSGKPCRTYTGDVKIAISLKHYVYPDASVICGKIESTEQMPDAALNPLIIVEVQSPSTGLYDREGKFQAYRQIKSFREYVLISQDKILVEVFYKPDDKDFWQYRSYDLLEETVLLKSIDSEVSMAEIYLDWERERNKND